MTTTPSEAVRATNSPDWDVTLLRATFFTEDLISPSHVEEWWKKVMGSDPEEISRKPALGSYSMSGPRGDASIALNVSPGRMDWLEQVANVEDSLAGSLGKLAVRDRFVDLLTPLLQFPSISLHRAAFGVLLRSPVASRIEGYRALGQLLPSVRVDPDKSRDFLYQINRPRNSVTVPGLAMNRISRWAVTMYQVGVIGSPSTMSTAHHLQLDLDMSTDQDSKRDISRDGVLLPLFRELVALSAEIAQRGDVE